MAALLGTTPTPTPQPLAAVEKKAIALSKAIDTLIADHPDLDPDSVSDLHQTLLTAAAELAQAFNLPT